MIKMHPIKFFFMFPYLYYYPYKKEYTIEEAEIDNQYFNESLGKTITFGALNSNWEEFKLKFKNGDKLYLFRSPLRCWYILGGSESFIIERNGEKVASFKYRWN